MGGGEDPLVVVGARRGEYGVTDPLSVDPSHAMAEAGEVEPRRCHRSGQLELPAEQGVWRWVGWDPVQPPVAFDRGVVDVCGALGVRVVTDAQPAHGAAGGGQLEVHRARSDGFVEVQPSLRLGVPVTGETGQRRTGQHCAARPVPAQGHLAARVLLRRDGQQHGHSSHRARRDEALPEDVPGEVGGFQQLRTQDAYRSRHDDAGADPLRGPLVLGQEGRLEPRGVAEWSRLSVLVPGPNRPVVAGTRVQRRPGVSHGRLVRRRDPCGVPDVRSVVEPFAGARDHDLVCGLRPTATVRRELPPEPRRGSTDAEWVLHVLGGQPYRADPASSCRQVAAGSARNHRQCRGSGHPSDDTSPAHCAHDALPVRSR